MLVFVTQQSKDFVDILTDFHNPVYYSLLGIIFFLIIIYFFYYYIIFPLNKKHLVEKHELERKQMQLIGMFSDLDPDPVLRIDNTGKVIYLNNAASMHPGFSGLSDKYISDFIPDGNIDLDTLIERSSDYTISRDFYGKHYIVSLRGNANLNIAQIYFHDITDRKKFEERLKQSKRKLKALSHNLMNIIEEERQRIAGELHDGIGQNLLFLKLKLQKLENDLTGGVSNKEYESMNKVFDEIINDLRNVIYDLKPKILEEMGLGPALVSLTERVSKEGNIEGKTDLLGFEKRISLKKEIALFRIAQESLNNIVKHSGATEFSIQLIKTPEKIRMIISDDGKGFDIIKSKKENGMGERTGYGLMNIRERVSQFKGTFKIDSSVNTGTFLTIEIPAGAEDEN